MDSQTTDADDQHILRIANEIIDDLNISIFRPNSVVWAEDLPITLVDTDTPVPEMAGMVRRDVPVGWSVFTWDRVILNPQMKGRLSPAEWRPLLVSSLIYEARLRGRRDLATILAWTPFIIDGIGWWWLFAVWTSKPGITALLAITDSVGLIAAFIVGGLLSRWLSKRLKLEADTLASSLVGREILKRVLEKMESLGLVDEYAGSLWGMGYPFSGELMSGRPTLAERIRNLKAPREARQHHKSRISFRMLSLGQTVETQIGDSNKYERERNRNRPPVVTRLGETQPDYDGPRYQRPQHSHIEH